MAVAPFAKRRLIAPGSNDPRINATQVILHVAVSEGASLFDFFARRSGGIESHFYIRRDGTIEQYRDTAYEADANYTANCRAISVETQGMGDGEWTPAQLDAIKRLLLWAHDVHGIPLEVCSRHDAPGVGFHVLFGAPGPWTPVAKSCPGPDRIKQFHRDIVPWMDRGASTTEEDDMPTAEEIAHAVWAKEIGGGKNREAARLHMIWASNASREAAQRLRGQLGKIRNAVEDDASRDDIKTMLDNLAVEVENVTVELKLGSEEK